MEESSENISEVGQYQGLDIQEKTYSTEYYSCDILKGFQVSVPGNQAMIDPVKELIYEL